MLQPAGADWRHDIEEQEVLRATGRNALDVLSPHGVGPLVQQPLDLNWIGYVAGPVHRRPRLGEPTKASNPVAVRARPTTSPDALMLIAFSRWCG